MNDLVIQSSGFSFNLLFIFLSETLYSLFFLALDENCLVRFHSYCHFPGMIFFKNSLVCILVEFYSWGIFESACISEFSSICRFFYRQYFRRFFFARSLVFFVRRFVSFWCLSVFCGLFWCGICHLVIYYIIVL